MKRLSLLVLLAWGMLAAAAAFAHDQSGVVDGVTPRFRLGAQDPSASPGVNMPIGSIFRRDASHYYTKVGTGTTDWELIAPGSAGTGGVGLVVRDVVTLRTTSPGVTPSTTLATTKGCSDPGDGGGGVWYWSSTSTATDNIGTVVKVASVTTGRWQRIFGQGEDVSLAWFCADRTGVADATTKLAAVVAIASVNATAIVDIPPGTYKVTDTITVDQHGTHIKGHGPLQTFIKFDPVSTKTAFKFKLGTAAVLSRTSIEGISFFSSNTSATRTAVEAVDVSEFRVSDVRVAPWFGTGSVGLRLRGREMIQVREFTASAPKPLVISVNPNIAGDCLDHAHFSDLYLTGTAAFPVITVDDGVVTGPVTFDGGQAWVGGSDGLRWDDTTSGAISQQWLVTGVRYEAPAPLGRGHWAFRISKTGGAGSGSVTLVNLRTGNSTDYDGIYLRGMDSTLINCQFDGTGAAVAYDNDGRSMHVGNQLWLNNATVNDTSLEAFSVPMGVGPVPPFQFRVPSTLGAVYQVTKHFGTMQLVAAPEGTPPSATYQRGDLRFGLPTQQTCYSRFAIMANGAGTPGNWDSVLLPQELTVDSTDGAANQALGACFMENSSFGVLDIAIAARRTGGSRGTGAVGDTATWHYECGVQNPSGNVTVQWCVDRDAGVSGNPSSDLATCGVATQVVSNGAGGYVLWNKTGCANVDLRWTFRQSMLVQNPVPHP